MRFLLIDDLRNWDDIQYFGKAEFPENTYQLARTYNEGISKLRRLKWDILYLDHDLGGKKTGYDILCWLEEHPEFLPGDIIFVTSNPVGRQRMQQVKERLYKKEA